MYKDKILNTAYSFAAAIVVFGAWAKLEQKEFGGLALTIGLLTESGIFLIYGLMEWLHSSSSSAVGGSAEGSIVGSVEGAIGRSIGGSAGGRDELPRELDDVKAAVQKTNTILQKVFREV